MPIAVKIGGLRQLLLGAFLAGAGIGTLLTFWSQIISQEHHWSVYATGAALTGILFLALLLLLRTTMHSRRCVEERLTSILKNIDIGVWSIDATPARQILFLSPAFEHIVGVPLEEIRGGVNHWINYYHPDDREGVLASHSNLAQHGHCSHDARVIRPDGQVRWVNFRGWAHVDTKGNIDRFDGITQDLTDRDQARQALQETENRFRLAADTAPVMICLKDRDGKCVFLNKAWQEYTGQRENEWLGDGWQQPIHPDDLRLALATLTRALTHPAPFEIEFRLLRSDGTYGWVLNRGAPRFLDDGTFEGLADSFLDITETKCEERREQILSRLATALSRATTRLELAQVVATITGETWSWDIFFMAGRRNGDDCMEVLLKVETENGVKKERSGAGEIWEGGRIATLGLDTSILVKNSESQDSTLELVRLDEKHPRPSKVLFAPIQGEADILGVISLHSVIPDFFSEADAVLLERIAQAVGPALRRALSAEAIQVSENRLRLITDSTRDAIVTTDNAGIIMTCNRAAERMFGYAPEEIIGQPITIIMPERFRNFHDHGMQSFRRSGESPDVERLMELTGQRRDGSEFPLEISRSSWVEGGQTYFTKVISDLTERKEAEALRQAKELAERASEAKNFFLSRMSHELRTPMNAILGFARLMQMDELSPTHSESIGEILKAGRHLLNLINEVLDISRIEAGEMSLSVEPVLLGEVIGEVCSLVQPLALKREITIYCDGVSPSACAIADKQRLKQVLLNLVANAIKYNREEGSVTVGCHAAGDERVRITVTDTGAGMPPEHLLRLFRPFDRLGADQTEIEGTGLGLALSHRLVGLMGGETGVESEVGVGTTFWVELQAAPAPEPENVVLGAAMEHPPKHEGPRGTVLYVEDNVSNLRLVEKIMARRPNLQLITAMHGQQGIDLATELSPDMILLDLDLPDMHGSKVLQAVQAEQTTKDIPVIIISADATPMQIERLLAAGARAYLTKPLNVVELLNTIDDTMPAKGHN